MHFTLTAHLTSNYTHCNSHVWLVATIPNSVDITLHSTTSFTTLYVKKIRVLCNYYFLLKNCTIFKIHFFNCCSSTIVSISPPPLPPVPPTPSSHPRSYPPLALSMCPLYMSLDDPSPSSPGYPHPPLWLLSLCSLFHVSSYILLVFCFVD